MRRRENEIFCSDLFCFFFFFKKKGRKVPSAVSVENPKCDEIVQVLKSFKLEHVVEDKRHPADFFTAGRVRVKLFQEDGKTPVVADIPNRRVCCCVVLFYFLFLFFIFSFSFFCCFF
jgi:signal recognition particle subunit SEC65